MLSIFWLVTLFLANLYLYFFKKKKKKRQMLLTLFLLKFLVGILMHFINRSESLAVWEKKLLNSDIKFNFK